MTIEDIETRIGQLSVRAIQQGGEELLDRVEQRMGVAIRLADHVRAGRIPLSPAVMVDVTASFERAEELLGGVTRMRAVDWRGEHWVIELAGASHGTSAGAPPSEANSRHQVAVTCARTRQVFRGWVGTRDLDGVSAEYLEAVVDRIVVPVARDAALVAIAPAGSLRGTDLEEISQATGFSSELLKAAMAQLAAFGQHGDDLICSCWRKGAGSEQIFEGWQRTAAGDRAAFEIKTR